ncbi:50S ribosomal protein L21 [Patescibacteria group bacterium]|nr:50S ribosomal protein L21 [Patescibacteria group bacterium]
MKYAVIRLGGKQFIVKEKDKIELERQQSPLNVDVLLYSEDENVLIGEPVLDKVLVEAEVVEEKKGDKVRVVRFKSKSRYRKVKGHRQPLSVVEIKKISLSSSSSLKAKPAATEKKVEPKEVESKEKKSNTKKDVKDKKVSARKSMPSAKKEGARK